MVKQDHKSVSKLVKRVYPNLRYPFFPGRERWRGLKVGLLGGSFNPAHEAHVEISLAAIKRLGLDYVWWMVSPQNPLKSKTGMASVKRRKKTARKLSSHHRIKITSFERRLGTRYSADSIKMITRMLPETQFVWLMGADNLAQFSKWQNWQDIANMVPVAIFDRPGYSMSSVSAKMAQRFHQNRLSEYQARSLTNTPPPAWVYCHGKKNPLSATEIRSKLKK